MKRTLSILLLLASAGLFAQTQNFWTKKNDFGAMKRERAIGFSVNGKGYIGMGVDTNEVVHNDLWQYDASTDLWTQKANLPGSVRRDAIGLAAGNRVFVGLGIDSAEAFNGNTLSDFWEYLPATNTWTSRSAFPGAGGAGIYFATAFSIDNKVFVCCGKIGSDNYSDEVWEYKPSSDTWIQHQPFPGGDRYQLCSFVVNNVAYIGLGADYNTYRKDIWEYHPSDDTWTQKTNHPGGVRGSATTFTLGERGFVCLGVDGGLKNDLWEYNPYLDSWTARATYGGSARKSAAGFTLFGKAYVGTGDGYSGKKASMYEYTPMLVLGEEEYNSMKPVSVYPTLIGEEFTITSKGTETVNCALYTASGELVRQITVNGNVREDRNGLASGMYLLVMLDENGQAAGSQKLLFR